ncbi:MAG: hypothetical protein QF752_02725 [Planctomycetota bacterium]|nr:hypothetical protein [Planctomycetota bacterium]
MNKRSSHARTRWNPASFFCLTLLTLVSSPFARADSHSLNGWDTQIGDSDLGFRFQGSGILSNDREASGARRAQIETRIELKTRLRGQILPGMEISIRSSASTSGSTGGDAYLKVRGRRVLSFTPSSGWSIGSPTSRIHRSLESKSYWSFAGGVPTRIRVSVQAESFWSDRVVLSPRLPRVERDMVQPRIQGSSASTPPPGAGFFATTTRQTTRQLGRSIYQTTRSTRYGPIRSTFGGEINHQKAQGRFTRHLSRARIQTSRRSARYSISRRRWFWSRPRSSTSQTGKDENRVMDEFEVRLAPPSPTTPVPTHPVGTGDGACESTYSDAYDAYPGNNNSYAKGDTGTYGWPGENFNSYRDGQLVESASNRSKRSHLEVTSGRLEAKKIQSWIRGWTTTHNFRVLARPLSGTKLVRWTNQVNEARFNVRTFHSGDTPFFTGVHLFARYQTEYDLYVASLRKDGNISIKKKHCKKYTTLAQGTYAPMSTRTWYTLRFEVCGNSQKLYINGKLVLESEDDTFSWGTCGIRTDYCNVFIDDWKNAPLPGS